MNQRDASERTDVLFDDQGSTHNLWVRGCESFVLKKMIAPPYGVLADAAGTEPVQVKAGFQFSEDDKSYTLWMVGGSSESADLHNEYVLSLYRHTANLRKALL